MSDVTRILRNLETGGSADAEELLPLVYEELRRLAASRIAREGPDISLQATGLVHEAYMRLVDTESVQRWDSRGHFFGAAAEAMRRILVERARKKRTKKLGGDRHRLAIDLDGVGKQTRDSDEELLALDDALSALADHDQKSHQLVMLRYFGGLGHQEAAGALGIGRREADRLWSVARAWLHAHIREQDDTESR